jgi:hypothetical protein
MKKLSGISVLVSAILLTGLCGCGSDSADTKSSAEPAKTAQTEPPPKPPKKPKDKRPIEERLTVGMTTDEVKAACGKPHHETMSSDGSGTWEYDNGANAFIPYYSATGHKIHQVVIVFDTGGKVKSWSTSDTGMY